ncbi:geranylgeranyl pyrophosphate synthase-like [Saccoglossus kowalevskii]|uniref:Geranylgeranyl pyrophosphate synthase-like n=1 Tax=Saccoglossus kowalevskii TaxID=10224 RepID=A0ABM0H0G3_SACKO|nr:PREDICTED: geranylgeranyl pyrophosphate synthase-like [Saccoglossus kowalevskii]
MASNVSGNDSGNLLERNGNQERILLEPFHYLRQVPGKEIRMKLTQGFNHWLNIPEEKLHVIGEVVQMLHNASLLIDDIEDNSKLRRGIPVAHNIYGIPHTINCANYVFFLALQKLLNLNNAQVTQVYTEQLLSLHEGQGMDIWWRDAYVCPTEEEYKDMVIKKTGGLFGLGIRLMQIFSENKCDFKPLWENLGLYFQIRDDYANLKSPEYKENKSYAEDLTEGKFSFPLIHAIKTQPENTQVMSILKQRTTDNDIKKYCIEFLDKVGSFDYTKSVLLDLEEKLRVQIAELGGNPYLLAFIDEMHTVYLVH